LAKAFCRFSPRVSRLLSWSKMISMISTRSALSCAPTPYLVHILSFAYSQSAYWLNNNLLCCNGCVGPLGCFLSDPVLKLMINYLLSLYLYVLLFTSCSVTYLLPPETYTFLCSVTFVMIPLELMCYPKII
jgi:hypothetical protein